MEEDYDQRVPLIMKNDVHNVALRPEGKSVVSSIWIYNITHAKDGSIKNYKTRFVVSLKQRE